MLDGLLDDWRANVRPPFEGIQVLGAMWSSASHDVKDFLARSSIPYRWLDVDQDAEARSVVDRVEPGEMKLPVLIFPDGTSLVQPSPQEVAEKAGLRTRAELPFYDMIIVGSGPAGLSAAVYASADGLRVLLIERHAPAGRPATAPRSRTSWVSRPGSQAGI